MFSLKTRIAFNKISKSVYKYLEGLGFEEETIKLITTSKISMPFERIDSMSYLTDMTDPPPRSHFSSVLKSEEIISIEKYQQFLEIWRRLNVTSLFQLFSLYLCLDSLYLGDSCQFYAEQIYNITGFHMTCFSTISGLALKVS